jgi:hypothetical protein
VDLTSTFGCAACYGEDPEAAWRHHVGDFEHDVYLADDSHFIVAIRHCRLCSQRYVSIFTEFVDWHGGQDAQYTTIVPITEDEAAVLTERGEHQDLEALGALGQGRRYLVSHWPSHAREKRIHWSSGSFHVVEGD